MEVGEWIYSIGKQMLRDAELQLRGDSLNSKCGDIYNEDMTLENKIQWLGKIRLIRENVKNQSRVFNPGRPEMIVVIYGSLWTFF